MSPKQRKFIQRLLASAIICTIAVVAYFGYRSYQRIQNPSRSQLQGHDTASYVSQPIEENGLTYTRQIKLTSDNDTVESLKIIMTIDYRGQRATFNTDDDFKTHITKQQQMLNKALDDNLPLSGVRKTITQEDGTLCTTIIVDKGADQSGLYFMLLRLPDKGHNMNWITAIRTTNKSIHASDFDIALQKDGLKRE